MNDESIYRDFEEKWINETVLWLDFLRKEGRNLLNFPIPTPYLVSKSHFFDLVENGELHLQTFPKEVADFNINEMTKDQISSLYDLIVLIFGSEQCFNQMYLVKACRAVSDQEVNPTSQP